MTPSKCNITVKKARFYAFLLIHTLYQVEDSKISIYVQVSSPIACFFSTIQLSIFHRVFIHKNEMLSPWTKVSPLDFQHFNHFKYSKIWKERAFIEKVNSRWFCCFPAAILLDFDFDLSQFIFWCCVYCMTVKAICWTVKNYICLLFCFFCFLWHTVHMLIGNYSGLYRLFRCISLHFMNFVTFRFMSSKRDFATDGAPYWLSPSLI